MTQTNKKKSEYGNGGDLTSHSLKRNISVLGSHWNRQKFRDAGTGIFWNKDMNTWEAKVVRHLGYFDGPEEAGKVLEKHLAGIESWFVTEMMTNDAYGLLPGVTTETPETVDDND